MIRTLADRPVNVWTADDQVPAHALALAALIVIVAFAIANRTPVPVSFAPLPILIELLRLWRVPAGSGGGGLIGGLRSG